MSLKNISPENLNENAITLIGKKWMLVSAGNKENFNTMTASWGGIGFFWNKPVVYVFVRPSRYTNEFIENEEHFTLSFFDEQYRNALKICGSVSGRDCDKIKESGLNALFTEKGNPSFEEANLIIECRKMYSQEMTADSYIDKSPIKTWFADGDFHKMYIAEIVNVFSK